MNIILKEITKENYLKAIDLKVTKEQDNFVASNIYSIVQSKFETSWKPTAIYNDDEMVGFLMYGADNGFNEEKDGKMIFNKGDGSLWIIRLMIDVNYQRKGFGREAMLKIIEHIKNNYDNKEIFTSFVPANSVAKKLYELLGFTDTGRLEEGEMVYCLKLKA